MATWNPSLPGSSGHIHQSLWNSGATENLFASPSAEYGLSELARSYLAGLLTLSPDLTAIYSPTINSYRRYVPGMWAPLSASWGPENRTCSLRVINFPGPSATRIEMRQTAADINPYLAIATCLASGLYGVERRLTPPEPSLGDATSAPAALRLPTTLGAAAERLGKSELARQVLPEAFIQHFVRTRDFEVRQHQKSVSEWELERYFESI
jgi:glutamine synthetase